MSIKFYATAIGVICIQNLLTFNYANAEVCNQPGSTRVYNQVGGEVWYRNVIANPALEGLPVQNATVNLLRLKNGAWVKVNSTTTGISSTDRGKFCFKELIDGETYQLQFTKAGHFFTSAQNVDSFKIAAGFYPYFYLRSKLNQIGVYGVAALWELANSSLSGINDPNNPITGFDFVDANLSSPIINTTPCSSPPKPDEFCIHPGSPLNKVNGQAPTNRFYSQLFANLRRPVWEGFLPIIQARLFTMRERQGADTQYYNSPSIYLDAVKTLLEIVWPENPFQNKTIALQLDEEIQTVKLVAGTAINSLPVLKPTQALTITNQLYDQIKLLGNDPVVVTQSYAPNWCDTYPLSRYTNLSSACLISSSLPVGSYPAMHANSLLFGGFGLSSGIFNKTLDAANAYWNNSLNLTRKTGTIAQIHLNPVRPPFSGNTFDPMVLDCRYWNSYYRLTAYQQIKAAFDQGVPVMFFWEGLQLDSKAAKGFSPAWGWKSTDPAIIDFKNQVIQHFIPALRTMHHLPAATTMSEIPDFMPRLTPQAGSICPL